MTESVAYKTEDGVYNTLWPILRQVSLTGDFCTRLLTILTDNSRFRNTSARQDLKRRVRTT